MIIANETVAKYLKNNNLNSIYRNHEKPNRKNKRFKKIINKE